MSEGIERSAMATMSVVRRSDTARCSLPSFAEDGTVSSSPPRSRARRVDAVSVVPANAWPTNDDATGNERTNERKNERSIARERRGRNASAKWRATTRASEDEDEDERVFVCTPCIYES